VLDRHGHGRRGWSPGEDRMPGRDAHGQGGRRTPGGRRRLSEEHLRIGALEDAGDAGASLELLLDDRPDGGLMIMSSLGLPD